MSANQHTPGPWMQHLVNVQRDITGPQGQSIAYTRGVNWSGDRSEAEEMANARLIASAPQLLEALTFAVRFYDQLTPADAERMRAVVNKATGAAA